MFRIGEGHTAADGKQCVVVNDDTQASAEAGEKIDIAERCARGNRADDIVPAEQSVGIGLNPENEVLIVGALPIGRLE